MKILAATLPPLLILSACAVRSPGTMTPEFFKHNDSGYEFLYVGEGPEDGMGDGWRLDNYERVQEAGQPVGWVQKQGPEYLTKRGFDLDDDGKLDTEREDPVYDLRYVREGGGAEIWIRSVTLADTLESQTLAQLAERYVAAVRSGDDTVPHFGEGADTVEGATAAGVVDTRSDCQVAVRPAHRADYVSDVSGQPRRTRLVLVDPGYRRELSSGRSRAPADYRVILLAVYAANSDAFDDHASDFDTFLARLALGKGQGPHTCLEAPSLDEEEETTSGGADAAAAELEAAANGAAAE